MPCRVAKIERPAPDVTILGVRLPMNENMLFLAGQYIDFLLKDGKRRSYSIASKPAAEGVTALSCTSATRPAARSRTTFSVP